MAGPRIEALERLVGAVLRSRAAVDRRRSLLVAVSGIDGSGKGYVTARAAARIEQHGLRVAVINVDAFLNLPRVRFSQRHPAEHFYANAIRFDVLFERLLLPLRDTRSVHVELDVAEETDTAFRRRLYDYRDVDVVLVEGIYLLRRFLLPAYDLSCWIECSLETALRRAVARAQEGLPPDDTVRAYHTIYFPAQQLHFLLDQPREAASIVIANEDADTPAVNENATATVGGCQLTASSCG